MLYIKTSQFNRPRPDRRLHCTLLTAVTLSAPALSNPLPTELPAVTVHGQAEDELKTERSGSAKISQPLLDTPQTITVIPKALLKQENVHSLRGALSNVSGITFNAGEGGGGSGDNINIRGFSAANSLQLDGMRDSALNNRTDLFNVETLEVIKGPNSVFGGSGATGGNINLISKQPRSEDFLRAETALGSDRYRRIALDHNLVLPDAKLAWRLNVMAHGNDVPGRKHIEHKRWGVAPSLRLGEGLPTQWTLSYFHQTDRNQPDYGVPALDGRALAGVARDAYFGWRNLDRERINSNVFTSTVDHQFATGAKLQNITRHTDLHRDTTISAAQVSTARLPPGRYLPGGPQGLRQDVMTRMLANQTTLNIGFDTGSLRHQLLVGAEFSEEKLKRQMASYVLAPHYPQEGYPLKHPPGYWPGPQNIRPGTRHDATLKNAALFIADSIQLTPQWEAAAGLRHDWIKARLNERPATGAAIKNQSSDRHLSTRASLTYLPAAHGRIYLAYGTSFNPSAEALIGNSRGLSARSKDVAPERNSNWELGSKWDVMNGRLALSGSLFQVTKHNARESNPDGSISLSGMRRVRGFELAAAGKLSTNWSVHATYTHLNARTIKMDRSPQEVGRRLANTPSNSANLWSTYAWPSGWIAGYGISFIGSRPVNNGHDARLPAHAVQRAMLGYKVNRYLDLQLNIDNLTDKVFVERARLATGGVARASAVEYGDGRSAVLTANWTY